MQPQSLQFLVGCLTLAATLAACGSVAETPVHPVADLAGTEWLLARLPGDQPIPRGMEITLNWQGDGIRGHAGCNGYFSAGRGRQG